MFQIGLPLKKVRTQSYSEDIKQGYFKNKIANEWKRMNAMDVSDVYYDTFLITGKNESQFSISKAGDKVRLRISKVVPPLFLAHVFVEKLQLYSMAVMMWSPWK